MRYFEVDIKEEFPNIPIDEQQGTPKVTAYLLDNTKEVDEQRLHPAMVIFPGGGYHFTSDREAEPIALAFLARGFNVFVVRYSVYPTSFYPKALIQGAATVAYIRRHAKELQCDKDAITVTGFSAGAHVAGCVSTLYRERCIYEALGTTVQEIKPNSTVLCYGVLSSEKGHEGSIEKLTNFTTDKELLKKVSIDKNIDSNTSPMFLWTTAEDELVNPMSTLLTAAACQENGVAYELHVYQHGKHGMALATYVTMASTRTDKVDRQIAGWVDECTEFLKGIIGKNIL